MAQRRVLLADDHPMFREALRAAVNRLRPDFLIDQADSLASARAALQGDGEVDLVLLDLKLPDSEGLTGLVALRAEFPRAPIIVVSASEDAVTVNNAIAAGALGFIPKSASMAMMSDALGAILAGDVWTPDRLTLTLPVRS
jgi:DNA-binding NarL/FixJ family response regulator